jgi:hypothetical protein
MNDRLNVIDVTEHSRSHCRFAAGHVSKALSSKGETRWNTPWPWQVAKTRVCGDVHRCHRGDGGVRVSGGGRGNVLHRSHSLAQCTARVVAPPPAVAAAPRVELEHGLSEFRPSRYGGPRPGSYEYQHSFFSSDNRRCSVAGALNHLCDSHGPVARRPRTANSWQHRNMTDEVIGGVEQRLSWGSAIGILYAVRHREKVAAYVGVGQVADMREGERLSYEFALREAGRRGHRAGMKALTRRT